MSTRIIIRGLDCRYPGGPLALDRVDLDVGNGEKLGIVGPNGAGKTTLFHCIAGLLRPAGGSILVNDAPVRPGAFNPAVGLVFQNPDDQLFNTSVLEDVVFGPLNLGMDVDSALQAANEAMRMTGCDHLRDRPPHRMSGGEKRMAAIASVISMRPGLLIYDEPTSNLDARARRSLIDFIVASDATTLIASHDLEFVIETCDRTVLLDAGSVVKSGDTAALLGDEALMNTHGLEMPHSLLHFREHTHVPTRP